MRSWVTRGLLGFAVVAVLSFLFVPLYPVDSVQIADGYLSLVPPGPLAPGVFDLAAAIPTNCSTWHELFPAFCVNHHQDAFNDNGDGVLSACDEIVLDGITSHIKWVGPTYYLTCFPVGQPSDDVIWEPNQGPHDPASPICETWQEVWPNLGALFHIDDFVDNDGSNSITPCDDLFSGGVRYHVNDIRLNIIIEPPSTPVKRSTWGWIKSRLGGDSEN